MVQMKVRQKTRHKTPEKYHDTVALNEDCKIKGGKYYILTREGDDIQIAQLKLFYVVKNKEIPEDCMKNKNVIAFFFAFTQAFCTHNMCIFLR